MVKTQRILVRIVKDWAWAGLLRQTPGQTGVWDGIQFTLDPVEECDFLIMLNNRKLTDTAASCPKENVWALMQEPYVKDLYDWMVDGHQRYANVLTHYRPSADSKYIAAQPAIPWHVNRTFDELVLMARPEKSKNLYGSPVACHFFRGTRRKWLSWSRFASGSFLSMYSAGRVAGWEENRSSG